MNERKPILFYDGKCPLCTSFVQFLFHIDKKGEFLVSPLQGSTAKRLLNRDEVENLRTIVLFENGKKWIKSDAVLEIFRRMGLPWRLLSFLSFLPKRFRDFAYQIVSRYRYKLFGAYKTCHLPNIEKERILN